MYKYGKLTVKGSENFDKSLGVVLNDISNDLKKSIDENYYEAIFLIGGYGRGEGGVLKVNNKEKAHNNFDFFIISKDINKKQTHEFSQKCEKIFNKHTEKLGIFVEFTIMKISKFLKLDPLLITYDMKYGHKLILGNGDILTKNSRFELNSIPQWDIRNLMVNRGTLLLINDLILNKKNIEKSDKKIIIKHWVKAIIGYGDALLYYHGEYDYSYVEKQKRMKKQKNVSKRFKLLYEKAMNFRFSPKYEKYQKLNINKIQAFLKAELYKVHKQCEELAIKNSSFDSSAYINKAVKKSLDYDNSLKAQLKKIYYLSKKIPFLNNISFLENIRFRMLGIKGIMPILFPFIIYGTKEKTIKKILNDFFQVKEDETVLKDRYLLYWKTYVNSNFVREDFGI